MNTEICHTDDGHSFIRATGTAIPIRMEPDEAGAIQFTFRETHWDPDTRHLNVRILTAIAGESTQVATLAMCTNKHHPIAYTIAYHPNDLAPEGAELARLVISEQCDGVIESFEVLDNADPRAVNTLEGAKVLTA